MHTEIFNNSRQRTLKFQNKQPCYKLSCMILGHRARFYFFVPKYFNSQGKKTTFLWLQTFPLETGHHGNRIPVSKIRTETMEPSQHASPPCTSPLPSSLPPPPICGHMYVHTYTHTCTHMVTCLVELLPPLFLQ